MILKLLELKPSCEEKIGSVQSKHRDPLLLKVLQVFANVVTNVVVGLDAAWCEV